jgi:glucokinase
MAAHAVGIDLGGTTVRTGVYDSNWVLLACITLPTRVEDGPEAVVQDMARCVLELSAKYDFRPSAIGLGSPGPLNLSEGRLLRLPNFPGWDFFPIRNALASATNLPVILESDGNAAALAEWRVGSGVASEVESMCMLTLGTGVGSGLILSGKVWHGRDGMAGELGHVCILANGVACPCGGRGCLERYASATAIAEAGKEWLLNNELDRSLENGSLISLTARDMAKMAAAGHAGMRAIFEQVGYYLGLSIAGIVSTLDLPLYVVGGGVADAWDLFAPALFRAVWQHSYVYQLSQPTQFEIYERGRPFITRAKLGSQAGLLGAAMVSLVAKTQNTPSCPDTQCVV